MVDIIKKNRFKEKYIIITTTMEDKEYKRFYRKSEQGKRMTKIYRWKQLGLKCDTQDDYDTIYWLYKNTTNCWNCNVTFTEGNTVYRKCMDHCHKTGKFREILCHRCNVSDRCDNTSGIANIGWDKRHNNWFFRKKIDGKLYGKASKDKQVVLDYKNEILKKYLYIY